MKIRALGVVVAMLLAMTGSSAWAAICTTSKTLSNQTCTGWRTNSTGSRYCTLWCTGSEICDITINGLSGSIMSSCMLGENCPVTSCAAFGTVPADGSVGTCDTSLDQLNDTCGITGVGVCKNPATKFNEKGGPFVVQGVQGASSESLTCDKKGKCTNSLKLLPEDTSEVCRSNWQFVSFTASEFKAKSCFCPGGFDGGGSCCADSTRSNGSCSAQYGDGTSICMIALCTVDLSGFDETTNFNLPYECDLDAALTCGGITGVSCP